MSSTQQTGLVLTGGGARAAYQVGAIRALAKILNQRENPFPILSGTSAGAINAAYLATHASDWGAAAEGLSKLWSGLQLKDIYRTDGLSLSKIALPLMSKILLGGKKVNPTKPSNFLLDTSPLRKLLEREVSFDSIRKNIATGSLKGVSFSAVQYFTGKTISFFDATTEIEGWVRSNRLGYRCELGVEHVLASSAIPVFFPPVKIGTDYYGDGCLRQTTPLSPAIHLGADRIISIGIRHDRQKSEASPVELSTPRNAPSLAEISGELMNSLFLDSLEADVERLQIMNDALERMPQETRTQQFGHFKKIPILQLRPSRNLAELVPNLLALFPVTLRYLLKGLGATPREGQELISYLAFLDVCLNPLMELGYNDTMNRRDDIVRFLG